MACFLFVSWSYDISSSLQVGAYLTQRLGFSNVGRLQGGIINYTTYWRSETEETGNLCIFSLRFWLSLYECMHCVCVCMYRYELIASQSWARGRAVIQRRIIFCQADTVFEYYVNRTVNVKLTHSCLLPTNTVYTGEDFNEVSKFKGLNFVFNDRMAEVSGELRGW